jgi:cytochrome P450
VFTLTSSQDRNKLPNIVSTPTLIQNFQALLDQFGTLDKCHRKYGDIFYTPASSGFPPFVILNDPKGIEQLLTADPNIFEINKRFSFPIRVLLGDNSLVVIDGIQHQRARKLLMPPLHGERMKSYGQTMVEVTDRVISQWQINKPSKTRDLRYFK